ncbi:fimbrial protein [Enterobacter dykesii]|uniref:fimbrial protein n=1 Tax=Enterobacter dykesii TaxID=2797506 RepID=UPI0032B50156
MRLLLGLFNWLMISILLSAKFAFGANCVLTVDMVTTPVVSFGVVTVQRDAPIGTIIATAAMNNSAHAFANNGAICDLMAIMNYAGAIKNNSLENVYDTNIPGVGISFYIGGNSSNGYASAPPGTQIMEITNTNKYLYPPTIRLIKTGNITSGDLSNELIATVLFYNKADATDSTQGVFFLSGTNRVTQLACTITNGKTLSFPIGDVPADEFKSLGMVSRETSQIDLGLDCDEGANINIKLTGSQNPDSSDASVLALTNQGQNGVADGIGVEILYNNSPLELNKTLVLKKSSGGRETFPLTAVYIQTKNKVIAGKANATATLDISYQ